MVILKTKDKEFNLRPTTRKVVELTDKLKTKNLNDLLFGALNDGDVKVLAEVIKSFSEYEDGKAVFTSVNNVYDFIDEWTAENGKNYSDLFREVIEVTNEMGFFKEKMSREELDLMLNNPISNINLKEMIMNSAQKKMDDMMGEMFTGYQA